MVMEVLYGYVESGKIQDAITLILDKTRRKPGYEKIYSSTVTLNSSFTAYQGMNLADASSEVEKNKIITRLIKIITELESVMPGSPQTVRKVSPALSCLRKIDFEKQDTKFQQLMDRSNFLILVIRGEKEKGQRWLLHQLLDGHLIDYHNHINFSFDVMNCDNETWMDNLLGELAISFQDDKFSVKCRKAIRAIVERLETNNQCIIFRQCYNYFSSDRFSDFFSCFLDSLNTEYLAMQPKHKLVIIFVENITAPYKLHTEPGLERCRFSYLEQYDVNAYSKFLQTFNYRDYVEFVCLHPIDDLDVQMIARWVDTHAVGYKGIEDFQGFQQSVIGYFNDCCADGNPQKIIEFICDKLNYDKWAVY
jgi:hypothetical protein